MFDLQHDGQLLYSNSNNGVLTALVVQGGSLVKGTDINNDADVDLVPFFKSCKTVKEFREKLPSLLDKMKNIMSFCHNIPQIERITVSKRTVFCEIYYVPQSLRLTIDIVPAISNQGELVV